MVQRANASVLGLLLIALLGVQHVQLLDPICKMALTSPPAYTGSKHNQHRDVLMPKYSPEGRLTLFT